MSNKPEYPQSGQISCRTSGDEIVLTFIGEDQAALILERGSEYFSATWTPRLSCSESIKAIRELGFLEGNEVDSFVELADGPEVENGFSVNLARIESSSEADIRFVRIDSETRSIVISTLPGNPRLFVGIGGETESISFLREAVDRTAQVGLKSILKQMLALLR